MKIRSMKKLLYFILSIFVCLKALSQAKDRDTGLFIRTEKPLIDTSAYAKWPCVERGKMTNDGEYITYFIRNESLSGYTTVLRKCIGSWERKIPDATGAQFTADNKMAIFMLKDTLCILRLGGTDIDIIPKVSLFQVPVNGSGEWIAFKTTDGEVVLKNIRSNESTKYSDVVNFSFSENGRVLLLEKKERGPARIIQSLYFVDIGSKKIETIWKGSGLVSTLLNPSATILAFILSDADGRNESIWCYRRGSLSPFILIDNVDLDPDTSVVINYLHRFSQDGKYIFFTGKRAKEKSDLRSEVPLLRVWSYLDVKLQSMQVADSDYFPISTYAVNIQNGHFRRLNQKSETILEFTKNDDFYLIESSSGEAYGLEYNWNIAGQRTYYIRSVQEGVNIPLKMKGRQMINLSPNGKYVIYYDIERGNYFSYEVSSGIYRNITSRINVSWINYYREDFIKWPRGIAGWLDNDLGVLVYDRFDIWLIDPSGQIEPKNITNGYGCRNNILFYLGLSDATQQIFSKADTLILNATDLNNKKNGFYEKILGEVGDPKEQTMGNYIYYLARNPYLINNGIYPIKSRDKKRYLVMRMRENESPNFFFTADFKSFVPISSVYPERAYNWYRTELHTWKDDNGKAVQGVLYKPENFDSTKRYPVIFYYYEKKSFGLHEYLYPEDITGGCNINVPTFVSNGYLIFSPDINYTKGDPMQGTLDAVVSAARYLSSFSFVDSKRMGIGGCSFGGFETNYLVTHSSLFAAGYSASSLSDLVSAYGDVPGKYASFQGFFETGQGRMGGTLWQKPDMYIKNSPIFNADKVSTPLLLMHTTNDQICSFSQALEFFTALRRLGKRAWLLEYAEGNHGVSGRSATDFGIRLKQFFDHYLIGKPAPRWMTRGISAKMSGIDTGYELDFNITTPGRGLLAEPIN